MAKPTRAAPAPRRRTRISAALTATETKNNRHWQAAFLAALAETSNVTAASAAAGVNPSRPYKLKRAEPDFARRWRESAFVPIVTPSLVQLRAELQRQARNAA